ncbi:TPA: hypothetical protein HA249_02760 [Candidatus Woesearchaeota archaeon]|nr:hypothetical protein [Candidatus Woesearchaeota archaeon]HIH47336.1 hypothetical protein [Candidatus Woesearchaeota archaeon]
MKEITKAEMDVVLKLVKSPEVDYNANNLAKVVGITAMGALKILKRLESESILKSKKIGKAIIYRVNQESYARRYIGLILSRESLYANPLVKRWIGEVKKIKNADLIILFGSVLEKSNPNDIDLLLVTDQKRFPKLQEEIKELNKINIKKLHPLYQTYNDLIKNIKKRDKPLLNAIKGIVGRGEEKFLDIYHESRKE